LIEIEIGQSYRRFYKPSILCRLLLIPSFGQLSIPTYCWDSRHFGQDTSTLWSRNFEIWLKFWHLVETCQLFLACQDLTSTESRFQSRFVSTDETSMPNQNYHFFIKNNRIRDLPFYTENSLLSFFFFFIIASILLLIENLNKSKNSSRQDLNFIRATP